MLIRHFLQSGDILFKKKIATIDYADCSVAEKNLKSGNLGLIKVNGMDSNLIFFAVFTTFMTRPISPTTISRDIVRVITSRGTKPCRLL